MSGRTNLRTLETSAEESAFLLLAQLTIELLVVDESTVSFECVDELEDELDEAAVELLDKLLLPLLLVTILLPALLPVVLLLRLILVLVDEDDEVDVEDADVALVILCEFVTALDRDE